MGSTGVPVGPTVILRYTYDVCASNWGVTAIEIGPTVTILNNVLIVLIFLTSILLTLTILMHKGQGGGLSDMFGGGISSSAGSSGVAERNLNRITMGTLFIWVVCIIGFVLLYIVNQVLSTVGTFFLPLSVTTDGHFSTEIMWTSYLATMGTEGHPNVIGIGSYVLVPLFALILGLWASRSIEKHTSLR